MPAVPPPFVHMPSWDPARFRQPGAIFRGAPFWSWNGPLDADRLIRQLDVFERMGLGGGHMHARTGLATAYLGEQFMACVRAVADEARRRGMLAWLYDEDRWPSGFAGGLVTDNPDFRTRSLLVTRRRCEAGELRHMPIHHGPPQPTTDRAFVAAWTLRFDRGLLAGCRRMAEDQAPAEGETALYAYRQIAPDWSWFNHQQYADLLNPRAIARFIEVTHQRYARVLGDHLGTTAPAIFTDEPLFRGMGRPDDADDDRDLWIAWTDDLPETFGERFGEDLLDLLPRVLFDAIDGSSPQARWRFRDHHTQRFVDAFAAQIGRWCDEHGIALTGHMMAEPTPGSQSEWVGEAMRSLRHFQLPGIDLLCDRVELTTAKQAQSMARQCGRPGVLSELYGVTNWDFAFAGHLRQGNWQAAMGITVRVHHLSWYAMTGEAKRDYPASIGWHMPWWREYAAVEDHFARVGVAMQTGRPICRVAMVHPIESRWIVDGPNAAHAQAQATIDRGFVQTLNHLLYGLIDADLLAESLLEELCPVPDGPRLAVGEMAYEAVVLPPMLTMRSTTLARLKAFAEAGGQVFVAGQPPRMIDAQPSDAAVEAARQWTCVGNDPSALVAALAPWREVDVHRGPRRADGVLYQLREESSGDRVLFVCRADPSHDLDGAEVRIRGRWHVEAMDTNTGEAHEPGERWTDDGWTHVPADLPVAGHLLWRLRATQTPLAPKPRSTHREVGRLADPVPITLSEPNVLLLDRAAWRVDDGDWQAIDEVLRVDNHARDAVGLPRRHGDIAQPWVEDPTPPKHRVTLGFAVNCDVPVTGPKLALERAGEAAITLDGSPVGAAADGWYVDEDIATVPLPDLAVGEHRLEVTWPLGPSHGLEACYLLGRFGVTVAGPHARIIAAPRELAFDDWTRQGLPFYGGNVTYHCRLHRPDGPCSLRAPRFAAALLAVNIRGERLGRIIRSPYRLDLPPGSAGEVPLDITAFGDRFNTFGQLHNFEPTIRWAGPASWRTTGEHWTDGYRVRAKGLLAAPIVEAPAD